MPTLNAYHEEAIAAFHSAAAAAGVGGDGRYTRAIAFLEGYVRKALSSAGHHDPMCPVATVYDAMGERPKAAPATGDSHD